MNASTLNLENESNLEAMPSGVEIYFLNTLKDNRGSFTEIFRNYWFDKNNFIQWNYLTHHKNALRGVHIHPIHTDYLVMLTGTLTIGLLDLRKNSNTYKKGYLFELLSEPRQAIRIPNGVAHGLYSQDTTSYLISVDRYWSLDDDLGCHWQNTKNYIQWPCLDPILSERDTTAQNLEALELQLTEIAVLQKGNKN